VRAPHDEIVNANGVDLCVDSFGDPADPAIVLIMGSSGSMDWWEDEFCERLAAGQRFVVRYDHRDTGRSVSYDPGSPEYSAEDLIDDVVGVIGALSISRAHLVGMSMGGAIAQGVALGHPDRVASLTLVSTSSAGPGEDLPGMSEETIAAFSREPPDWSNRSEVLAYMVHLARVSASPAAPFDEAGFQRLAGRVFERTTNIESSFTNHSRLDGGEPWRDRLGDLDLPTLIIHGTDDPVLPHEHGVALANEIPGAELLTLEQTGHELPRRTWDLVVPAILEVTSR
jgi:pimeloyl-ACP methyl ester carboxylesterase